MLKNLFGPSNKPETTYMLTFAIIFYGMNAKAFGKQCSGLFKITTTQGNDGKIETKPPQS